LAVAAVISLGALRSVRNVPLGAIACVIPSARHLDLLLNGESAETTEDQSCAGLPQWVAAGAALLLAVTGLFSARLPTDMAYPAGALGYMKAHNLQGNVLGDFGWGEYLIWHLSPKSKVFVDSRFDMVYPVSVFRDYITFYYDRPGAAGVLTAYPHDFVLIPPNAPANSLMGRSAGWTLLYRDPSAALFARITSSTTLPRRTPELNVVPALRYFP
jgi:hypothetical protein